MSRTRNATNKDIVPLPATPESPSRTYYAHTLNGPDGFPLSPKHWEPLLTLECPTLHGSACAICSNICHPDHRRHGHINKVAHCAALFAQAMYAPGSSEAHTAASWGRLAGLWHDLGKYSMPFQAMLHETNGNEAHLENPEDESGSWDRDHSSAGAQHATIRLSPPLARLLSYAILGHHGHLPDFAASAESGSSERSSLQGRLKKVLAPIREAPAILLDQHLSAPPPLRWKAETRALQGFQRTLWVRMLFSCLVDADRLSTGAFTNPEEAKQRQANPLDAAQWEELLNRDLAKKAERQGDAGVKAARQSVLEDCRQRAEAGPGLFSLTVPTGGGKTLSSLAFALRHIQAHPEHGFQRIIYVVPFISIIDQNAKIFRELLKPAGSDIILEHHSNLDPAAVEQNVNARLSTENWDAPFIVTTAVQFYETLFAAHATKCRKLHRIARSVIVLDEVQTLPVKMLEACMAALRELAENYGCTIVLCTATQPTLERSELFPPGFPANCVREIVSNRTQLFKQLKRVLVQVEPGPLDNETLARALVNEDQALCIVNTKRHAAEIFALLPDDGHTFHLSTNLCPVHREAVLEKVRVLLDKKKPCRIVSTQLIEAGVDVDFPVVYRSIAGLDSIAQAAGRCNREGLLENGRVIVFTPADPHYRGMGYLQQTGETAETVLTRHSDDPLHLTAIEEYFQRHYHRQQETGREGHWDEKRILDQADLSREGLVAQFRFIARRFCLIETVEQPVVVPYDAKGKKVCADLTGSFPADIRTLRLAQRYTVNVPPNKLSYLRQVGDVTPVTGREGLWVLSNTRAYDRFRGLVNETGGVWDPESLMC